MPVLPNWEGLHPLVVHFPLVLLLLCPLFLTIAIIRKEPAGSYALSGWALLVLGTAFAFLAKESGQAAAELVFKTQVISPALQEHAQWAGLTCGLAFLSSLVLTTFLWVAAQKPEAMPMGRARRFLLLILIGCLVLAVLVVLTGHEGAFLVHSLGVTNPASFPPPGP